MAVWLVALLAGFSMALYLTPSEAGLGTHQQLGLPPCTVRVLAGIRCPSCGMTTSFAHFVRGEWAGSVRANAGGLLLALFCLAQIPWLAAALWTGRVWDPLTGGRRPERLALAGLAVVGTVTLIDWAYRLAT